MDDNFYKSLKDRHEAACSKIILIKSYHAGKDLLKFARSCDNIDSDLSKERVNCRRIKHQTIKYGELLKQYEQSITVLEEYVIYAMLIDN